MKIAACLITKGDAELEKLKKSVASFERYVDEIHIVANWEEYQQTEKWCLDKGINFYHLPWDKDFSKQRNFCFSKASKDVDYIYWQDSDDILIGGEKLREVAEIAKGKGLACVYFTYWYSCLFDGTPSPESLIDVEIAQMRERLIDPRKMYWSKWVHETPVEIPGVQFSHSSYPYDEKERPMVVLHTGATKQEDPAIQEERMRRNQEILELELEHERAKGKPDPRTILYLMKILPELHDEEAYKRCIVLGEEYLSLSGWDEERCTCLTLMGRCALYLGEPQQAIRYYHNAISQYPKRITTYLRLAEAYFEVGNYRDCEHWLTIALEMQKEKVSAGADNILEDKLLATDLTFKLNMYVKKKIRNAYKAIESLYELNPIPQNKHAMEEVRKLANLDIACSHVDKLCQYLAQEGQEKAVLKVLQALPQAIASLPFAVNLYKKYAAPRIWAKNEICYYANFNGSHFEHWSPNSLKQGIGGSETAVIELAREWVKNGYKVTVYGDPGNDMGVHEGVLYLPWFYFNPKDKFNILIQWRAGFLADKVSAKKFYVDLHDVAHPNDYLDHLDQIDGIFVKSEFHKNMLEGVPSDKIFTISNGIEV